MLLYRTHSIAYHHVCNTPAIDISHLIYFPQNQWSTSRTWIFSCTEEYNVACICYHYFFMFEIALFKVSSLVEHIVENYWSKFDVTGKQMNVQLE